MWSKELIARQIDELVAVPRIGGWRKEGSMQILRAFAIIALFLGGGALAGGYFIGGPEGIGIGAFLGVFGLAIFVGKVVKGEDRRSGSDTGSKSGEKVWKAVVSTLKLAMKYRKFVLVIAGAILALLFFDELAWILGGG